MTPKQKAEELVDEFKKHSQLMAGYNGLSRNGSSKQSALICVNEIIKSVPTQPSNSEMERIDAITFWMLVKEEIEKL